LAYQLDDFDQILTWEMGGSHPKNPSIHLKLVVFPGGDPIFWEFFNEVLFKFKWKKHTAPMLKIQAFKHSMDGIDML